MEGQITLTEWMQWREDIRRKLQETASNFVYIGYRLKQIRDSGMYDGCEDIFEFAQKEYGLSKSITSRFIAINEKFSEGGNSLEIREEYQMLGSSKLSEMLTLSEEDCQLITAKTTVKEIRELKHFNKQEEIPAEPAPVEILTEDAAKEVSTEVPTMAAVQYTPLQKCIIDFFRTRREVAKEVMDLLENGWKVEEAAKVINPGEHITHKKGIVFLFMYDFKSGVAYKQMGQPEPVKMTWDDFLNEVTKVYADNSQGEDFKEIWDRIYLPKTVEKRTPKTPENRENTPVATSQQNAEKTEKIPSKEAVEVLGNEEKEVEEKHSVDVNEMIPKDHSSQAGTMVEPIATGYDSIPVDHLADAGEMVEDHAGEATEKVPVKLEIVPGVVVEIEDINKATEAAKLEECKAIIESIPGHTEEENSMVAPKKIAEEETEIIPPPRRATEWRSQVNRCLSNLHVEIKSDAWEAAKTTLRKMEHYIDLVVRTGL